jgi:hypothetical protein
MDDSHEAVEPKPGSKVQMPVLRARNDRQGIIRACVLNTMGQGSQGLVAASLAALPAAMLGR